MANPESVLKFISSKNNPNTKNLLANAYGYFAEYYEILWEKPVYRKSDSPIKVPLEENIDCIINGSKSLKRKVAYGILKDTGIMTYLDLQKSFGSTDKKRNKTMAIQKCGNAPYEISLRFAGCNLRCGLCFASGYSWPDLYLKRKSVTNEKTVDDVIEDFKAIPYPPNYSSYNWLRVLGGEPLLNDKYIDFLFEVLINISEIDSKKVNNGIIIQTNGIYIGKGNTKQIKTHIEELYEVNPSVNVAIETSIKGTNPEEFKLLTQQSSEELFKYNLRSYFALKQLNLPNLRSMVVAGFGLNESFLLREGKSKDRMTIFLEPDKPCYHPDFWTKDFKELYDDFTDVYKNLNRMFIKMPMYGIKD